MLHIGIVPGTPILKSLLTGPRAGPGSAGTLLVLTARSLSATGTRHLLIRRIIPVDMYHGAKDVMTVSQEHQGDPAMATAGVTVVLWDNLRRRSARRGRTAQTLLEGIARVVRTLIVGEKINGIGALIVGGETLVLALSSLGTVSSGNGVHTSVTLST